MRKPLAPLLLAFGLLSACSTGSGSTAGGAATPDSGTDAAGGSGAGLPEVTDGDTARSLVYDSLEGKRIAYIPANAEFALTALWGAEMERTFEMLGAEFTIDDPAYDVDRMVQIIDSRINDGVDMLIIQNPDPGVLSEQVSRAHDAGIYVISLNVSGNQSSDAFIGADYRAMAHDLAERIVDDCAASGRDKVAVISGWGTDSISMEGDLGWLPVFEEAGLEVVSNQQSSFDPQQGNQIASTVLQANPDLCGFAVVWDLLGVGVGQAVEAAGLSGEVGVYNFDASAPWCESLRDGVVTAGSAYAADGIGVSAAVIAQQLFLLGNPPGSTRTMSFVPHSIVDASNVDSTEAACYGAS